MNTTIREEEGKMIAEFAGRLDTLAAVQTAKDVQPLIDSACQQVVLDCSALEYISSSGLRIFISILKSVKARKGEVIVQNINDEIRKVFEMTGFNKLFIIK
ncbi:MAG: STAS domain-containing protein [Bacteroidaceae bacterium]|nr:STAS domain-containing protein [Bacteroidaceae bacterium]MBR1542195.1 STAS domain-containing protein [Bacteroidaceae bacterium]